MKSKSLTKWFLTLNLKSTHKYCISSGKHFQHLFNAKALRGGAINWKHLKEIDRGLLKKRRVIPMKFENLVIVSFQITVNNDHYGIY